MIVFRCDQQDVNFRFDNTYQANKCGEWTKKDGNLFARAQLTRIGVFTYIIDGKEVNELRDPQDVFAKDSYDSFKLVPVTDNHPLEMVNPQNFSNYSRGSIGEDIYIDGEWMNAPMTVNHDSLITKIEKGKNQVSNGYRCFLVDESGTYRGVRYSKRQKDIRGNHVAVVDQARAGSEAKIMFDSKQIIIPVIKNLNNLNKTSKNMLIKIHKVDYDAPEQVVNSHNEYKADAEKFKNEAIKYKADSEKKDGIISALKAENEKMNKIDHTDSINNQINNKIELASKCSKILKKDLADLIKVDEKTLICDSIKAINSEVDFKEDSIETLRNKFDGICSVYNFDKAEQNLKAQGQKVFKKTKSSNKNDSGEKEYFDSYEDFDANYGRLS